MYGVVILTLLLQTPEVDFLNGSDGESPNGKSEMRLCG